MSVGDGSEHLGGRSSIVILFWKHDILFGDTKYYVLSFRIKNKKVLIGMCHKKNLELKKKLPVKEKYWI